MRITFFRRLSQFLFLALFLWFCVAATLGEHWWQLRGWPVNWFIQIDPLAAVGALLTTRAISAGLIWALGTIVITILFGRLFCGWVCPLGTMQHLAGFLGRRRLKHQQKREANRYRPLQALKYYILFFLLFAGVSGLLNGRGLLLTGLLDPVSLAYRSVNLTLLPLVDRPFLLTSVEPRFTVDAWLTGAVFIAAVFSAAILPRAWCRFICPLGALLGIFARFSLWRIGKRDRPCSDCSLCETNCQGGCEPASHVRDSECLRCMNCAAACGEGNVGYRLSRSNADEGRSPDITRRGFLVSAASGLLAAPMMRLGDKIGADLNPRLIRPPGALPEPDLLARCLRCGQCMRICPANIIQPAGLEAGMEGIWTPVLNYRIGNSGCLPTCVACANICPTGAIRPLTLDEKLGRDGSAAARPVRIGTAFVDHGRCLPWAMERPCLVCLEVCPVSPKAIYLREDFVPIRETLPLVAASDALTLHFGEPVFKPDRFASGNYFVLAGRQTDPGHRRIVHHTARTLTIDSNHPWDPAPEPGTQVEISLRIQRPFVDPARCVGCGMCEHECPVAGVKAIRVTADNESRGSQRSIL